MVSLLQSLMQSLSKLDVIVVLAILMMQITVSTVYYFSTFRSLYMQLVSNAWRQPVYDSTQLPTRPLRSLAGTAAAALLLTLGLNVLAVRLHVDSWQDGLHMAGTLLLIDACLNARHHFFEGRPLALFLLHTGYHAIMLVMTCCLLAGFGQPAASRGGGAADRSGARVEL